MSEPETWLGNIRRVLAVRNSAVGRAIAADLRTTVVAPSDMVPHGDDLPPPRTACIGCGLPLPHAAGECKREAK
jgi:hypothetical protein